MRSADYTIQGFIYQFNKSLLAILEDEDESEISIEGIVEDIEVKSAKSYKAIQCKYHETKEKFTLGLIYKPILQMLDHYYKYGSLEIEYKLFAHFPNEKKGTIKKITVSEVKEIFKSKDKTLKKLIESLDGNVNVEGFCSKFTMEFGSSLDELILEIQNALVKNGMLEDDVDTLLYPNSLNMIADLSILHDPSKRIITKAKLLKDLAKVKQTAISRWTVELKSLDKLLKARKKQVKENLGKNSRLRYFLISDKCVENFNEIIVTFICDYLEKFHFKEVHDKTPIFCLDCSNEVFNNIISRLHKKSIRYQDGIVANKFEKSKFIYDPVRTMINKSLFMEFQVKLLHYNDEAIHLLNEVKCEDCFVLMDRVPENLDIEDLTIELISLKEIEKIKYVMGMSDNYE